MKWLHSIFINIPSKLNLLIVTIVFTVALPLLTSCAYPQSQQIQNQGNVNEYIPVVQQAVDQYLKDSGVLPIKNSQSDSPIYEKYVVDFSKLQRSKYLLNVPANAFEKGGIYIYVIVDVDTKPQIKLMHLPSWKTVREIQSQVDDYQSNHNGNLPLGFKIKDNIFYLDFKKIEMTPPQLKSFYHPQQILNFIIDQSTGQVAIDYGIDLMLTIQAMNVKESLEPGQDLRKLLVEQSVFIPVSSFPYRWIDEQPIPLSF
jgi:hypothetical protein